MEKIDVDDFINFIICHVSSDWYTTTGCRFRYSVGKKRIVIFPKGGADRPVSFKVINEFTEKYNKSGSRKTTDYAFTANQSYLVSFLKKFLKEGDKKSNFSISPTHFSKLNKRRKKIFDILGASLTSFRKSWCALSTDKKYAIFTIWIDQIENNSKSKIYDSTWKVKDGYGINEQRKVIEFATKHKIPCFGLLCKKKDESSENASIGKVEQKYLVCIELSFDGHVCWADLKDKFLMTKFEDELNRMGIFIENQALNDTNVMPSKEERITTIYKRDQKIRNEVLKIAKGRCEYCNTKGFKKKNGIDFFLECHHIIALANDGQDLLSNVVALCPNHHREIHFGENSEVIEKELINKISRIKIPK